MGDAPVNDKETAKRQKFKYLEENSETPTRPNILPVPQLTPQSQVQLRAKSGRNGQRTKFRTLSLKGFANFKQEHLKMASHRGKSRGNLFRSPSIYEDKNEHEDKGDDKKPSNKKTKLFWKI